MKKLILFAALASLASCSGKPKTPQISYDDYHGYYKIGQPYKIDGEWFFPKEQPDYDEVGTASWYGDDFHGKKTANGDTFDKNSLSAAHNTLPLPSMVRVTNLENNKTLIVMINDRGPFAKGRVIDLSQRSAEILGFKDKGVAKVRVQFLKGQTARLLASLKNAPNGDKKSVFSFFKSENPSPYTADFDEESAAADGGKTPLDLLSENKDKILEPVKKLSQMLTPGDAAAAGAASGLPEIKIEGSDNSNSEYASSDDEESFEFSKPTSVAPVKEADLEDIKPAAKASDENMQFGDNVQNATSTLEESLNMDQMSDWQTGDSQSSENDKPVMDAAEPLKMVQKTAVVANNPAPKMEVVPVGEQNFVQAGTFSVMANAQRVEKALRPLGDVTITPVMKGSRKLYRVRLGPIPTKEIAKLALQKVIKLGHPDAMLINEMASTQ